MLLLGDGVSTNHRCRAGPGVKVAVAALAAGRWRWRGNVGISGRLGEMDWVVRGVLVHSVLGNCNLLLIRYIPNHAPGHPWPGHMRPFTKPLI